MILRKNSSLNNNSMMKNNNMLQIQLGVSGIYKKMIRLQISLIYWVKNWKVHVLNLSAKILSQIIVLLHNFNKIMTLMKYKNTNKNYLFRNQIKEIFYPVRLKEIAN
jgi:hypothetical protein